MCLVWAPSLIHPSLNPIFLALLQDTPAMKIGFFLSNMHDQLMKWAWHFPLEFHQLAAKKQFFTYIASQRLFWCVRTANSSELRSVLYPQCVLFSGPLERLIKGSLDRKALYTLFTWQWSMSGLFFTLIHKLVTRCSLLPKKRKNEEKTQMELIIRSALKFRPFWPARASNYSSTPTALKLSVRGCSQQMYNKGNLLAKERITVWIKDEKMI